jgi:hypothetical protein
MPLSGRSVEWTLIPPPTMQVQYETEEQVHMNAIRLIVF